MSVCAIALSCVGCKPTADDASSTSSLPTIPAAATTTSSAAAGTGAAAVTTTVPPTSALAVGGDAEKVFAQAVPGYQTLEAPASVVNEFLSSLQSEAQAGDVLDSVAARLLQSTDASSAAASQDGGTIVFSVALRSASPTVQHAFAQGVLASVGNAGASESIQLAGQAATYVTVSETRQTSSGQAGPVQIVFWQHDRTALFFIGLDGDRTELEKTASGVIASVSG